MRQMVEKFIKIIAKFLFSWKLISFWRDGWAIQAFWVKQSFKNLWSLILKFLFYALNSFLFKTLTEFVHLLSYEFHDDLSKYPPFSDEAERKKNRFAFSNFMNWFRFKLKLLFSIIFIANNKLPYSFHFFFKKATFYVNRQCPSKIGCIVKWMEPFCLYFIH